MYAIVETCGKQYRVSVGQLVKVEDMGKERGETIELDKVVFYADKDNFQVGKPYIEGAKVISQVADNGKSKKVMIFKFRRKTNYRRKQGHRQAYTQLRIKDIVIA